MDKQNITQCYWHANGQLECKSINVPVKQQSRSYVEFNTFSNPNMNYKPNEYHQNYNYYQQPVKQCCFDQKINQNYQVIIHILHHPEHLKE